ncbi:MAG: GTP cyclohydrolase I FolE2, partial [Shimia sp.]|nr:GTP cyclohydrolase I FolE2 [Shimia sp.]
MNVQTSKTHTEMTREEAAEALMRLRAWAQSASVTEIAELDPAVARLLPDQPLANYPDLSRQYPEEFDAT